MSAGPIGWIDLLLDTRHAEEDIAVNIANLVWGMTKRSNWYSRVVASKLAIRTARIQSKDDDAPIV
jgi:hypothetical protein